MAHPAGILAALILAATPCAVLARQSVESEAEAVLGLINAERAKVGCGPLIAETRLTAAALVHSRAMAQKGFFEHRGSDGHGPASRARVQGYAFRYLGENIAAGIMTPPQVVAAWMASPGHRANIVECGYIHTGIAITHQGDDKPVAGEAAPYYTYWVQVFGRPK